MQSLLQAGKMVQFYCKCSKQFSKFLDLIPFTEGNASMKSHSNYPTKKDLNNAELNIHPGFFWMLLQWAEQFSRSGDLRVVFSPAAKAEHMTKNIPTAILFSEEGSKPFLFKMGSTSLSFKGIRIRISTASNMVSQAAGNWKGTWLD